MFSIEKLTIACIYMMIELNMWPFQHLPVYGKLMCRRIESLATRDTQLFLEYFTVSLHSSNGRQFACR